MHTDTTDIMTNRVSMLMSGAPEDPRQSFVLWTKYAPPIVSVFTPRCLLRSVSLATKK